MTWKTLIPEPKGRFNLSDLPRREDLLHGWLKCDECGRIFRLSQHHPSGWMIRCPHAGQDPSAKPPMVSDTNNMYVKCWLTFFWSHRYDPEVNYGFGKTAGVSVC